MHPAEYLVRYDVKTPMQFAVRNAGKTLVTKSQGMKLSTDGLKGRVLEANLADLNNDDEQAYRSLDWTHRSHIIFL